MSTFRRRLMHLVDSVTVPEGCTRVLFLQSSGTLWIDTGHVCLADEDIYIDFQMLHVSEATTVTAMGWRWKDNYTHPYQTFIQVSLINSLPDAIYNTVCLYNGVPSNPLEDDIPIAELYARTQVLISPTLQQITVNGKVWEGRLGWADLYGGAYSNYLFSFNKLGSSEESNRSSMRLFEYWVKDSLGAYVQHLLPILDQSGVACLYDTVSQKFHYNKGTGAFGYSLDEAYIENYLNAYVDTGVTPDTNTLVEIKYGLFTDTDLYPAIYGAGVNGNRLELIHDFGNSLMKICRWGVTEYTTIPELFAINEVGNYTDHFTLNNEVVMEFTNSLYTSSNNLHLFNTSRAITGTSTKALIFYCKIYDGDVLIRDFVPHYVDGQWGFIDKINNVFYTSANFDELIGYIPPE